MDESEYAKSWGPWSRVVGLGVGLRLRWVFWCFDSRLPVLNSQVDSLRRFGFVLLFHANLGSGRFGGLGFRVGAKVLGHAGHPALRHPYLPVVFGSPTQTLKKS